MKINLENLGTVNKNKVTINGKDGDYITVFFSYETAVSFKARIAGSYLSLTRKNDWSTTTGKLLNQCEPDKTKRVSGDEFEQQLSLILTDFE